MLSKKAKYAIKALVYLGHKEEDNSPVLISQIASDESIPQKFLEAILLTLKKEGVLDSKKGRGGGYFIVKPLEEVSFAEILRIFDGPIALLPCVTYDYYKQCDECKDEATCGIRKVFLQLRNITVKHLKDASILDVVLDERKS